MTKHKHDDVIPHLGFSYEFPFSICFFYALPLELLPIFQGSKFQPKWIGFRQNLKLFPSFGDFGCFHLKTATYSPVLAVLVSFG